MLAVWINVMMVAAFGSLTNNHCAPTVCAQDPTLLTTTPSQSQKNARRRNGDQGDADGWAGEAGWLVVPVTADPPISQRTSCVLNFRQSMSRASRVPTRVTCRGMATTPWTLGCDAADPRRLAAFWASALSYVKEPGFDEPDNASIIDPDGVGPAIGFLLVPEGKTSKNRMHIDIRVALDSHGEERANRLRTKASELVDAGATQVREEFYGDDLGHIVMLDPEGNEFCVG